MQATHSATANTAGDPFARTNFSVTAAGSASAEEICARIGAEPHDADEIGLEEGPLGHDTGMEIDEQLHLAALWQEDLQASTA